MRIQTLLRNARRRAGLTQRALAQRAGVPQSTVGRIEAGAIDPRASTLDRLLRASGHSLEVELRLGEAVDRTLLRGQLALSPRERIESMALAARNVAEFAALARESRA